MRLTLCTNRWTQVAALAAWVFSSGCQRLPYIDQSKQVPHDNMGKMALEDKEVKQADFLSSSLPMQLPKVAKPRTTNDPEAQEVWPMTLQEAIRIGLDNAEVIRVINLGAQGIPIEGFEPTFLVAGPRGGPAGQAVLGGGGLASVYDPAVQETQIAQALSVFDTAFTTQMNWGKNTQPFNNAIQGGSLSFSGPKTPVISIQDTANFQIGLQKRSATGAQLGIVHNVNWLYQNSTFLVTPSVYTTNIQMSFTQPLLGSAPLPGQPINNFSNLVGLEANRAPIVIARLQADESVWNFKLNVMEHVRSIEQQYWILARKHVQLWSSEKAVDLAREIVNREQAELVVGKGTVADVAEAQQRLEQFSLELVTRTSDLLTTERQLRNLLGLPPADNRRIIPVTPPTEARLEPDWDASLAQMLTFYPDIVQQQIAVRVAELQLVIARNQLLPQLNLNLLYQLNGLGQQLDSAEAVMTGATIKALEPVVAAKERAAGCCPIPASTTISAPGRWGSPSRCRWVTGRRWRTRRFAQYVLLRQRAFLQQMVHQRPTSSAATSWKSTPTTSSSRRPRGCGPPPPSGSTPSGPTTRKAGSRSTASSTRSASTPRRSPPRRSGRPSTTSRSSSSRKRRVRSWPTTTSPWPRDRCRGRRTSRPATSRTPTASCRSRTTARCTTRRSPGP